MSCSKCEDSPVETYVRVGKANVGIFGCEEHLRELLTIYNRNLTPSPTKDKDKK